MQPGLSIEIKRQLIKLSSCEDFFDRDYDSLAADAEMGTFLFAWDIATPGASRRELRVWRDCALAVWNNAKLPELTEDQVYRLLLPQRDIRSTHLQRILSCSQELVRDLDLAGSLPVSVPRAREDGPNAYTLYQRDGVEKFLRSRRL